MSRPIQALVDAANAPLADPEMNSVFGDDSPRFELYNFALSLCSQKVRLCLVEKGASFVAHDLNLDMPQLGNYDPAYIRLRLAANLGAKFATEYSGRSSVSSEGFDAAVVPTLVDHDEDAVVADSLAICRYIDRVVDPANSLVPEGLASNISNELSIVDRTPHVAVLYGAHPDIDFRPDRLRQGMPGAHDRKIKKIKTARALVTDDALLRAAYDAKIAKEEAAKKYVTSAEQMRASVDEMLSIIADLEQRLNDGRKWICGDQVTLADLFWAVSLFRMKWLGMAFSWKGAHKLNGTACSGVENYGRRLFELPSFRSAVIDWPKTPRSEYVQEHYTE